MKENSVKDFDVSYMKHWHNKALFKLLKKKQRRKFRSTYLKDFYFDEIRKSSQIPEKSLDELVDFTCSVTLQNFASRNGNLTPYEVMVIATLVAHKKPMRALEIGTFDGNTTLQIALNMHEDGKVHTIDLPSDQSETLQPVLESDMQFIKDEKKQIRKFVGSAVENKMIQHFGDSTNYDFSRFAKESLLDFIFVDGGHSYFCVKSDTLNAMKHLAKNGWILWHDFTPSFHGVFQYLNELSKEYSLTHIKGTNLVLYEIESIA